jgi:hypothetical protein
MPINRTMTARPSRSIHPDSARSTGPVSVAPPVAVGAIVSGPGQHPAGRRAGCQVAEHAFNDEPMFVDMHDGKRNDASSESEGTRVPWLAGGKCPTGRIAPGVAVGRRTLHCTPIHLARSITNSGEIAPPFWWGVVAPRKIALFGLRSHDRRT